MVGPLTILVTADDSHRRDLYRSWLDCHEVRTAADGEAALDGLAADVDLVILDGDGSAESGVDVARRVAESPFDPYVVVTSAREVDLDVVAGPIDDYAPIPEDEADADAIVETFVMRREYEDALGEFFALTAKLASIEARRPADALAEDERYRRLRWLAEEKRAEVDAALRRSTSDWPTAFTSLVGSQPGKRRRPRA